MSKCVRPELGQTGAPRQPTDRRRGRGSINALPARRVELRQAEFDGDSREWSSHRHQSATAVSHWIAARAPVGRREAGETSHHEAR